jgi:hypothetical protein
MDAVEITCQDGWVEDAIEALVASVGTERSEAEYQRKFGVVKRPMGLIQDGDPGPSPPEPLDELPEE